MLITLIGPEAALIAGFAAGRIRFRRELTRTRTKLETARRLIEHDPLTGLANRVGAQRHHHEQEVAGRPPAAALVDLDDFKAVNDTWGHQVGDAHLAAVARRLAEACAPIGAHASRLAGDEFLLLIPHAGPAGPAVPVQVKSVLAEVSRPLSLHADGGKTVVTMPRASAGIALPEVGSGWADLLRRADIALYHAKAEKGRVMLHTEDMRHPPPSTADRGRRLRDPAIEHTASGHQLLSCVTGGSKNAA